MCACVCVLFFLFFLGGGYERLSLHSSILHNVYIFFRELACGIGEFWISMSAFFTHIGEEIYTGNHIPENCIALNGSVVNEGISVILYDLKCINVM